MMKMLLVAIVLVMGSLSWAKGDQAAVDFSMVEKDSQLCKVLEDGTEVKCIKRHTHVEPRLEIVDRIKAYDKAEKTEGKSVKTAEEAKRVISMYLVKPEVRAEILENYKSLSIRNLSMDAKGTVEVEGHNLVPVYFELFWKSNRSIGNGTLQVDAVLKLPIGPNFDLKEMLPEEENKTKIEVKEFSDSTTEADFEVLQWLETGARTLHFVEINGRGTNVEEDTLNLLEDLVGPVIVSEVLYTPVYVQYLKFMADAETMLNFLLDFFKGMGKMLDGPQKDIPNDVAPAQDGVNTQPL